MLISTLSMLGSIMLFFFFFQAEDGIRDKLVTGVQTCALPISFGQGAKARLRMLMTAVENAVGLPSGGRQDLAPHSMSRQQSRISLVSNVRKGAVSSPCSRLKLKCTVRYLRIEVDDALA